jgi:hypothetical protein
MVSLKFMKWIQAGGRKLKGLVKGCEAGGRLLSCRLATSVLGQSVNMASEGALRLLSSCRDRDDAADPAHRANPFPNSGTSTTSTRWSANTGGRPAACH